MTTLFIKNMVCNRCIMVVQNELDKLGLSVKHIKLGEVVLNDEPKPEEKKKLEEALSVLGFEMIDDRTCSSSGQRCQNQSVRYFKQ